VTKACEIKTVNQTLQWRVNTNKFGSL